MADPVQSWPAFVDACRQRLEWGAREYGNRSFSSDPATLIRQIQEELQDTANWAFILHTRLEAMRCALEQVSPGAVHDTTPAPPPFARADDVPLDRWTRARHDSSPPGRLCGAERGRFPEP